MADDIYRQIAEAEAFAQEWVIVVIDRQGVEQWWAGNGPTRYKGNAARYNGEATALREVDRFLALRRHRDRPDSLVWHWIKDTRVERLK